MNSRERTIKPEEFNELGIPEFSELKISENGVKTEEVYLDFDDDLKEGIPKVIEIQTSKILDKNIFKNIEPELEVRTINII